MKKKGSFHLFITPRSENHSNSNLVGSIYSRMKQGKIGLDGSQNYFSSKKKKDKKTCLMKKNSSQLLCHNLSSVMNKLKKRSVRELRSSVLVQNGVFPKEKKSRKKLEILTEFNGINKKKKLNTARAGSKVNKDYFSGLPSKPSLLSIKTPRERGTVKVRIVSRDKLKSNLSKIKLNRNIRSSVKLKHDKRKSMIDLNKGKEIRNIAMNQKLNKLINNKSRSIDTAKHYRSKSKKNRFVSEDKRNKKYMLDVKPITNNKFSTKDSRNTKDSENLNENNMKHNKYCEYLLKRFNKREDYFELKAMIKENFLNWTDTDLAELYHISNIKDFYEIKQQIGKGSFGNVFLARQKLTNKFVAFKAISKDFIDGHSSREKVMKEINILKTLNNNKFVIKLFEVFEDQDAIYLVFEFLKNGDLKQFFSKHPLFAESWLCVFTRDLLKGVKYIHENNIIHRDIKLDNILLDNDHNPKLCDFGISSIQRKNIRINDTAGTPAYLAPEVIEMKGNISCKTDIWCTGILLYLLSFGDIPFQTESITDLYKQICKGQYAMPKDKDISIELRDLIAKMLVVDPTQRISAENALKHKWFRDVACGLKGSTLKM